MEEESRKEKEGARVWGDNLKYHRLRILDAASRETRILVGGGIDIYIFSLGVQMGKRLHMLSIETRITILQGWTVSKYALRLFLL